PAAVEDIDNARKLCGLCGHLPLALRVAAANLATNPDVTLAEYATELDSGSRLAKFKIGDDPSANLTTVFHSSYRVLSLNTRQIFLHFGLIPGEDFTVSLAASLVSMDWNVVEVALRRLETAHLIEQHQPGRFRLHDLVRLFVRELASRELAEPQQEAAVDRLIEWYGDRSNPRLPEFDNILAACESLQRHPHLWKLVNALGAIANTGGDFQRARHFADIALSAAESNKDVEGQVYSLDALASFSRAAGDHEKSVDFRRAAANLLPHIDNDELEGKISNNLGNSLQGQGNLRESVYHLNHAVKVAHASNLDQLLIVSLGNLGGVLCSMGRFDEAFVATSRALKLVERRDDLAYIRALFTITRGLVFKDVGRYGDALLCGDTALEIADGLGATKVTVLALQLKGVVSHKATKLQQAVEYLDRAAVVAQTDPNIVVQIGTLHYQADVYLDLGDVERAFACLDTATGLARYWHSNSEARAQSECIRGRAFLASGEVGKAIEHGSKAAEIYRTLHPSPLLLGQSLVALGHAHNAQDNKDEALVCWNEALEIFTALKVPDAVSLREELQSEPMPSPPT
ncbi:MAG TPA: tetratricopeptide repeat protein, partial [Stackebrandtia sp.]|uniref:tetratricopeptide repeat protein n=1 Tax=Stackebrandtia sp. TaxID=2023065 RepID=UPI002D2D9D52